MGGGGGENEAFLTFSAGREARGGIVPCGHRSIEIPLFCARLRFLISGFSCSMIRGGHGGGRRGSAGPPQNAQRTTTTAAVTWLLF